MMESKIDDRPKPVDGGKLPERGEAKKEGGGGSDKGDSHATLPKIDRAAEQKQIADRLVKKS